MSQHDSDCPLDITAETLSAWRSGVLDDTEMERLNAHVPGCAACQRTVAGFERIAQSLRALPEPPRLGLWEAVQDGIARRQREARSRRPARTRYIFDIAALLFLGLLVAALFSNLGLFHGHGEFPAPTRTVTATHVTPSATSWIPTTADWVASPLTYGKAIAFAASAPLTGYACGNMATDPADTTTPILLGVTHDGGHTWQPAITTPALGVECHVYVNPRNANDVLLLTGGAARPGYHTLDGGRSWMALSLPGPTGDFATSPVWIGSTLYVLEQTYVPPITPGTGDVGGGPGRPTRIAVSQDGAHFGWLDESGLFSAFTYTANNHPTLGSPFAIGSTYYVGIYASGLTPSDTSCINNIVCRIAATSDLGATWTLTTPTGAVPLNFELQPDGKTLLGDNQNGNGAEVSRDAGQSWTALPPKVSGTFMEEPVRMTPDGTYYSIQTNVQGGAVSPSDPDVYKLSPGADSWTPLTSTQLERYAILTVSSDAQGHPLALWALSGGSAGGQFTPGIAYHRA